MAILSLNVLSTRLMKSISYLVESARLSRLIFIMKYEICLTHRHDYLRNYRYNITCGWITLSTDTSSLHATEAKSMCPDQKQNRKSTFKFITRVYLVL